MLWDNNLHFDEINRVASFLETTCQMTDTPFTHMQAVCQASLERDHRQAAARSK